MSTGPAPEPERVGTPVDGVEVWGAISPSRASDFLACPLAFRFRTIDKLPEPSTPAMARGTVVHQVLQDLYDLPAPERTPEAAGTLLAPAWRSVREREPELLGVVGVVGAEQEASWLASCAEAVEGYFTLEDPRRLEPAEREVYVETVLGSRLLLRGFVDRVDIAPDGAVRIVDYKTGRAPRAGFEQRAFFQLRFYALVWWRQHGVVPTELRLVYLGSGEILTWRPDAEDLEATRRRIEAIWAAIALARETGDWQPSPGPRCSWCPHQVRCPAYGGTPPALA